MRRVDRAVVDKWLDQNGPDGVSRLAVKSGVSASTIAKMRAGRVPVKASSRLAICRSIGVSEEVLFPAVGAEGNEAS